MLTFYFCPDVALRCTVDGGDGRDGAGPGADEPGQRRPRRAHRQHRLTRRHRGAADQSLINTPRGGGYWVASFSGKM
jgi:hypothetical protein